MQEWWNTGELKGFPRPIVLNIFFFLKGFALEDANTTCSIFLQCVCMWLAESGYTRKQGRGVLVSMWKGVFLNLYKKACFLSVLLFQGGMKAIFRWHLHSRSTWTQSTPVRPKWTKGEILWWRKLNVNHTKHSHSCTWIRCSHMDWGNKSSKISCCSSAGITSKALLQQIMQKTCSCGGDSHRPSCLLLVKMMLVSCLFSSDCWWHIKKHRFHPSWSPLSSTRFFKLSCLWTLEATMPKQLKVKPLGQLVLNVMSHTNSLKLVVTDNAELIKNNEVSMCQP